MTTFKNLSVRYKLYCLVGVFALGFLGFGLSASRTLSEVKVNGPYYARVVQGKDLIADVLPPPEYLIESYLVALQMLDEADRSALNGLVSHARTLRRDYGGGQHDRHTTGNQSPSNHFCAPPTLIRTRPCSSTYSRLFSHTNSTIW